MSRMDSIEETKGNGRTLNQARIGFSENFQEWGPWVEKWLISPQFSLLPDAKYSIPMVGGRLTSEVFYLEACRNG